MLPDFYGMVRLRPVHSGDTALQAGTRHHHHIDQVFHGAGPFVRHVAKTTHTLEQAGLSRGSARAIGHLGTELILDGLLFAQGHSTAAYAAALDLLSDLDPPGWNASMTAALQDLASRLSQAPLPAAYQSTTFVGSQLQRILDRRPRLRFTSEHAEIVAHVLSGLQEALPADIPALLATLRQKEP